jgi:hypothetical protein
LVVVTGSRITVIDASEHALGLNTPSRDTAPTKDHLNYCHQEHFAGFFRSLLQHWAGVSASPCGTPLCNYTVQVFVVLYKLVVRCRLFVCLFVSMGVRVLQPNWLIVPPALDVRTLATRCPRAYRRFPHSSGGNWNLWAGTDR